jgi:LuxR family transcriptional regulator, maltose regulon positive regulatory protein
MPSDEVAYPDEVPGFVSKILLPRRRSDVLSRPRLIDFLKAHLDRRLLVVCAAAGYGKTTLLVDFVHQTGLPTCWLTLGPADADPQVFLEYLVAAIRRRLPAFGERTLRYLHTPGTRDLALAVGLLVSDLHQATDRRIILVLDDLHTVDRTPEIQHLLDQLIDGLPANCCCIMASRSIPRIRFSRLVANRETAGLGTGDLRFTPEEIKQLFRRHFRLLVPDAVTDELAREAEGWIAGIILTSHTIWQGLVRGIIEAKRDGGPLFDFLAHEVFDNQDPEVRTFLRESSILARLSAATCDAVLERSDSAARLKTLDEENLFLTRLDGEGEWYRYHPLFQDFLRERLRRDDPARFVRLHARAGERAVAEDDLDAAIEHFRLAEDADRAADLVESVAERVVDAGRLQTFLRWCADLPAEAIADRPTVQIARAQAAFEAGDLTQAETALDLADAVVERAGDRRLLALARTSRGVLLRLQGRYAEAVAVGEAGLARAEEVGAADLIALASRQYGTTLGAAGALEPAVAALERSLASYAALGDRHSQGLVCHALGVAWQRLGELARARALLDEAADHARAVGNGVMLAGTLVALGELHHELGASAEALRVLGEAQRAAGESGHLRMSAYATATLADVCRDVGEFTTAQAAYRESLDLAERVGEHFLRIAALEALSRSHFYAGETTAAFATIQRARRLAAEREAGYEQGMCESSFGLYCLADGRLDEALPALEQACAWLSGVHAVRELARARLHLAEARLRAGEREPAVALAREALVALPAGPRDPVLATEARYVTAVLRAVGPLGPSWLEAFLDNRALAPLAPLAAARPIATVIPGSPRIVCHTLGHADVEIDGEPVAAAEWRIQTARELWFYLLAQGPASNEQIIEALWPELSPPRASNAFHQSVYRVRRALGQESVVRQENLWRVSPGLHCWVADVEFERLANRASSGGAEPDAGAREAADHALELYRGPYLGPLDADWCALRRRRLQSLYLRILHDLIDQAWATGRHELAIAHAERFLRTEPDDETVHEALMRGYAALGNRPAALRHYQRYAQQLHDELQAQPPRRLRLLSEQIAQDR